MTAKVLIADTSEAARLDLSSPAQPPVAVIARELAADDLPPGVALTPILPGTMLGLQIDEPLAALPVALTGLEVGENLRIGTRQTYNTAGATVVALDPATNVLDKVAGLGTTLNGMSGGQSGRIVVLAMSSVAGFAVTIPNNAGNNADSFLNPGGISSWSFDQTDGYAALAIYDGQANRWRTFPRGFAKSENVTWSGTHNFNGPNFGINTQGVTVAALSISLSASLSGFTVTTNSVERLEIANNGSWQVQGSTGTAGQTLVTAGSGGPPGWGLLGQAGLNGGIQASLLGTTPSATDTTNLSVGAITVPANSVAVGTTYIANLSVEFVHTASATPTLTLEWVYGGAVVATRVITVTAVAGTYTLWVEGYFRHTTIGAASSARVSIRAVCTAGATVADQIGETTAVPAALNTTISRTLELRVRMTTTVASNSITLHQATIQRLINQ